MTRTLVESIVSMDKFVTVKMYDDGAVKITVNDADDPYVIEQAWLTGKSDFKAILIAPKIVNTRKEGYYLRQGRVLAAVHTKRISSEAAYRKVWEKAGYVSTPKLVSAGYVSWINGQYALTTKGVSLLRWIKQETWNELAE